MKAYIDRINVPINDDIGTTIYVVKRDVSEFGYERIGVYGNEKIAIAVCYAINRNLI